MYVKISTISSQHRHNQLIINIIKLEDISVLRISSSLSSRFKGVSASLFYLQQHFSVITM